jgi:hypothetical protein
MIVHTFLAIDKDIETKPNEVYGLVSGQTNGHHDREFYEPLITMCIMYTIIIHGFWQWWALDGLKAMFRWVSQTVSGCPGAMHGPLATAYSNQGNIEITILCLKKENYKGDE